jgi:hypothetical protein
MSPYALQIFVCECHKQICLVPTSLNTLFCLPLLLIIHISSTPSSIIHIVAKQMAVTPTMRHVRASVSWGKRASGSSLVPRRRNDTGCRKDPSESLVQHPPSEVIEHRPLGIAEIVKDPRGVEHTCGGGGVIMPTLVPPPTKGLSECVLSDRRYPERSNRCGLSTPPADDGDMTPLDHMSPASATIDQILYA